MKQDLKIKKNKYGYGVYAQKPFKKSETIWTMQGEKMGMKDFKIDDYKMFGNVLQIGPQKYMRLDRLSTSFNHSCSPNMGFIKNRTLVAIRDIDKGEELTYDYSTTIDESFICDCRSKSCRKVVSDFFSLPKSLAFKYYRNHMLPDFIENKYKKLVKRK